MPQHDAYGGAIPDTSIIVLDTTGCGIWQIGNTNKTVFSPVDTIYRRGIMTDTVGHYPINSNNSFSIKIFNTPPNLLIKIWHKFQTDSLHDGGIIELSSDTGRTWINIIPCPISGSVLELFNFLDYDTLASGINAFSGNSGGEVLTEFQFFNCIGVRLMSSPCSGSSYFNFSQTNFIRFRFYSDSVADTLSGWMIDSIKIVNPSCEPGKVQNIKNKTVEIFPNPTTDEINIKTTNTQPYTISLYNMLGQQVYSITTNKDQQPIDVSRLPAGVYHICITNDTGERYYDKVVIEH